MTDFRNSRPEQWNLRAADAPLATLDIPADAVRERRFEIACAATVRAIDGARAPWHEMRVFANGQLQWRRRIPVQHPAPFDGLDYRFEATLPVGRRLRVQVYSECGESRRLQTTIEAAET